MKSLILIKCGSCGCEGDGKNPLQCRICDNIFWICEECRTSGLNRYDPDWKEGKLTPDKYLEESKCCECSRHEKLNEILT